MIYVIIRYAQRYVLLLVFFVCLFLKFGISHAAASIQDCSAHGTINHW